MKQKILSILTVLAMLLSLIPMGTTAMAADSETLEWDTFSGTFKYIVLDDQTVEITGYKGKAVNLQIPSEIDGKRVTTIGFRAFYNKDTFQIITVPEGIERFEKCAFQYCFNVIMFKLPKSLVSVGDNFLQYTKYYNDLPDGPIYYDDWFLGFKGDTNQYTNFTVEPGTKRMAGCAFRLCRNIESVTLPDGISEIGDYCFANCSKLTSVNLPNGIKRVGYNAFYGCSGLESVDVPYGVTSIGPAAFRYCTNIKSLTLPNTLELIENSAFEDCTSLTSVYVPDSVKQINQYALGYTYNKTLGRYERVSGFTIRSTKGSAAEKYAEANGYVFVAVDSEYTYNELGDGTVEITGYKGSDKNVEIPSNLDGKQVSAIAASAFKGLKITSVSLPNSIKTIGSHAFENCGSLKTVALNAGLTEIRPSAFAFCKSLGAIDLPQGLLNIDTAAFDSCTSLTDITVPASVNEIGYGVFNGCTKLVAINVDDGNNSYSSADGVLFDGGMSRLIKYPQAKSGEYTVPDGVKTIDADAFYRSSDIAAVTMPDSVTTVGSYAFAYCNGIQSVKLSNNLQSMGEYAFYGCGNVKSLELPQKLRIIPERAFAGWSKLQSLTVPSGVFAVGSGAFEDTGNLKEVTISKSVTSISERAFGYVYNYSSGEYDKISGFTVYGSFGSAAEKYAKDNGFNLVLTDKPTEPTTKPTEPATEPATKEYEYKTVSDGTVEIVKYNGKANKLNIPSELDGKKVTSLGDSSFAGKAMAGVTIPEGVKVIGKSAFENCASLERVIVPNTVTTVGENAFVGCEKLAFVVIPKSVTAVGTHSFGFTYDKTSGIYGKVADFTVYGNKGAESEKYASANGFKFVDLDSAVCNFYVSEATVGTAGDVHSGDTVRLFAVIGNSSENPCVQPYSVSFFINGKKVSTVTGDQMIAENGRVKVTTSAKLNAGVGTSTVTVVVNQEKSIAESDYSDNILKRKIAVTDD